LQGYQAATKDFLQHFYLLLSSNINHLKTKTFDTLSSLFAIAKQMIFQQKISSWIHPVRAQ
jgi:hypothetical protein